MLRSDDENSINKRTSFHYRRSRGTECEAYKTEGLPSDRF
ncbi:hypothetical protein BVRB_4g076720 isoform B [Beta vulgaris subsp. vulgaris]|nr:hypothetical protein BVRB_4g076720 isoform B [Beta vulgaris subsp. vulgaris]